MKFRFIPRNSLYQKVKKNLYGTIDHIAGLWNKNKKKSQSLKLRQFCCFSSNLKTFPYISSKTFVFKKQLLVFNRGWPDGWLKLYQSVKWICYFKDRSFQSMFRNGLIFIGSAVRSLVNSKNYLHNPLRSSPPS